MCIHINKSVISTDQKALSHYEQMQLYTNKSS